MRIAFYGDSLTAGSPGVSALQILESKLPEHCLINLGRGGDTVTSLYKRILQQSSDPSVDLAVVWIGTNDVLCKLSSSHTLLKKLTRQPAVKDLDAFRDVYQRMLQSLHHRVRAVLAVTPFLIGEDVANRWNVELSRMCQMITELSSAQSTVNLHSLIATELADRTVSRYLPEKLTRIALDVIAARAPSQVDALAAQRGLHFTLDGVHLNSAGAHWVADAILKKLEPLLSCERRPKGARSRSS